jgi:hypothetical protein
MTAFLHHKLPDIRVLCISHQVRSLFAFGSVLRSDFGPESDIDLLVEFDSSSQANTFRNFFDLKEKLEHLLGRPVDLITTRSISNPFFKEEVDSTKTTLYAA